MAFQIVVGMVFSVSTDALYKEQGRYEYLLLFMVHAVVYSSIALCALKKVENYRQLSFDSFQSVVPFASKILRAHAMLSCGLNTSPMQWCVSQVLFTI